LKLLVVLAAHYVRGPDGAVYTSGPHRRSFWDRYLEVFEEVDVLARVSPVSEVDPTWAPVDGSRVRVWDLRPHVGPWQYLMTRQRLRSVARQAVGQADAYLLRSGGNAVNALAWKEIRRLGRPYAVEVTSDPWVGLAPGTISSPLREVGRLAYTHNLKQHCWHAAAVAYVTRETLQRRYPAGARAYTTHYSSADMPPQAYVDRPRQFDANSRRLIYIGDLEHYIKGADVFIKAVAACVRRGLRFEARMLGDGARRPEFEALIRSLGVSDQVRLLGHLADRQEVTRQLDAADLFVLCSRVEGLPRSMIEAMGRALPCIGTAAGGTPELLQPEDLVPSGDAEAVAGKIIEVMADPQRMTRMSARNLQVAAEYSAEVLAPRRRELYRRLRELSEPLRSRPPSADHGAETVAVAERQR
jgi:glycosyltransferase involved in cell wall biosynthesis